MDGGACCGVDEEGGFAAGLGFGDEALEFRGDHAAIIVDRDGDDVFRAEAEEVGGLFDGVVAVG